MKKINSPAVRFIAAVLVATFSFTSSVAYSDTSAFRIVTSDRHSTARLEAAENSGVRAELRSLVGLPPEAQTNQKISSLISFKEINRLFNSAFTTVQTKRSELRNIETIETGTTELLLSVDRGVATYTLNRPEKFNVLTIDMVKGVLKTLSDLKNRADVRILAIKGAGGNFAAGADVKWLLQNVTDSHPERSDEFFKLEYEMDLAIANFEKPVIAFVDGRDMGGGLGITMAAHYVMATHRSVFSMPESKIGLFPDVGATQLFAKKLGRNTHGAGMALAKYYAFTSADISAQEAFAFGLADFLVRDEVSLEYALEELKRFSGESLILTADDVYGLLADLHESQARASVKPQDKARIIQKFFDNRNVYEIRAKLEAAAHDDSPVSVEDREFAKQAVKTMSGLSPLSIWMADTLFELNQNRPMKEVFQIERIMASWMIRQPDFKEGVQAQLIRKDRSPKFQSAAGQGYWIGLANAHVEDARISMNGSRAELRLQFTDQNVDLDPDVDRVIDSVVRTYSVDESAQDAAKRVNEKRSPFFDNKKYPKVEATDTELSLLDPEGELARLAADLQIPGGVKIWKLNGAFERFLALAKTEHVEVPHTDIISHGTTNVGKYGMNIYLSDLWFDRLLKANKEARREFARYYAAHFRASKAPESTLRQEAPVHNLIHELSRIIAAEKTVRMSKVLKGNRLAGKTILVSGATGEMGVKLVKNVLEQAATVILTSRTQSTLEKIVDDLEKLGFDRSRMIPIPIDITVPGQITSGVKRVREVLNERKLNGVVNVAGTTGPIDPLIRATTDETSDETLQKAVSNLFAGDFMLTHELLPVMYPDGFIINVSTIFSRTNYFARTGYIVPKAALNAMSKAAGRELSAAGKRVYTVFPGGLDGRRIRDAWRRMDAEKGGTFGRTEAEFFNMMRVREAYPTFEDVNNLIIFAATDEASGITNQNLEATNGMDVAEESETTLFEKIDTSSIDHKGEVIVISGGGDVQILKRVIQRYQSTNPKRIVVLIPGNDIKTQLETEITDHKNLTFHLADTEKAEEVEKTFSFIKDQYESMHVFVSLPQFKLNPKERLTKLSMNEVLEFGQKFLASQEVIAKYAQGFFSRKTDRQLKHAPRFIFMPPAFNHELADVVRAGLEALVRNMRHEEEYARYNERKKYQIHPYQLITSGEGADLEIILDHLIALTAKEPLAFYDQINLYGPHAKETLRKKIESLAENSAARAASTSPKPASRKQGSRLHGKRAVITNASGDTAKSIAIRYLEEGAQVALLDQLSSVRELKNELVKLGFDENRITATQINLSESIQAGPIDILTNLVNQSPDGNILVSNWSLIHDLAPQIKENGSLVQITTQVTNLSDDASVQANIETSALEGLTQELAWSLGRSKGVRVNTIKLLDNSPVDSLEIADTAVFLASDESAAIAGQAYEVTRGKETAKENRLVLPDSPLSTKEFNLADDVNGKTILIVESLPASGQTKHIKEQLAVAGAKVVTMPYENLLDDERLENALRSLVTEHGSFDSVIFNLGTASQNDLINLSLSEIKDFKNKFFEAPIRFSKHFTELAKPAAHPRFIFLSPLNNSSDVVVHRGIESLASQFGTESRQLIYDVNDTASIDNWVYYLLSNKTEKPAAVNLYLPVAARYLNKPRGNKVAKIKPGYTSEAYQKEADEVFKFKIHPELLKDQVALITGGSRGIGKATALLITKAGGKAALFARSMDDLKQNKKELEELGIPEENILVFSGSLESEADIKDFVDRVVEEWGRIDILINNAGAAGPTVPIVRVPPGPASEALQKITGKTEYPGNPGVDVKQVMETLDGNITSSLALIKAALPYLEKSPAQGKVINISTFFSTRRYKFRAPYSAGKRAMNALNKVLRFTLGEKNVRMLSVLPSSVDGTRLQAIDSAMWAGLFGMRAEAEQQIGNARTEKQIDEFTRKQFPFRGKDGRGRFPREIEVAYHILSQITDPTIHSLETYPTGGFGLSAEQDDVRLSEGDISENQLSTLKDKVVVVIAEYLHDALLDAIKKYVANGATVVVQTRTDKSRDSVNDWAEDEKLSDLPGRLVVEELGDLVKHDDEMRIGEKRFRKIEEAYGRIDIVISSPLFQAPTESVLKMSVDELREMFRVQHIIHYITAREGIDAVLRTSKAGSFLLLGPATTPESTNTEHENAYLINEMAKQFTGALAQEMEGRGLPIRVNQINLSAPIRDEEPRLDDEYYAFWRSRVANEILLRTVGMMPGGSKTARRIGKTMTGAIVHTVFSIALAFLSSLGFEAVRQILSFKKGAPETAQTIADASGRSISLQPEFDFEAQIPRRSELRMMLSGGVLSEAQIWLLDMVVASEFDPERIEKRFGVKFNNIRQAENSLMLPDELDQLDGASGAYANMQWIEWFMTAEDAQQYEALQNQFVTDAADRSALDAKGFRRFFYNEKQVKTIEIGDKKVQVVRVPDRMINHKNIVWLNGEKKILVTPLPKPSQSGESFPLYGVRATGVRAYDFDLSERVNVLYEQPEIQARMRENAKREVGEIEEQLALGKWPSILRTLEATHVQLDQHKANQDLPDVLESLDKLLIELSPKLSEFKERFKQGERALPEYIKELLVQVFIRRPDDLVSHVSTHYGGQIYFNTRFMASFHRMPADLKAKVAERELRRLQNPYLSDTEIRFLHPYHDAVDWLISQHQRQVGRLTDRNLPDHRHEHRSDLLRVRDSMDIQISRTKELDEVESKYRSPIVVLNIDSVLAKETEAQSVVNGLHERLKEALENNRNLNIVVIPSLIHLAAARKAIQALIEKDTDLKSRIVLGVSANLTDRTGKSFQPSFIESLIDQGVQYVAVGDLSQEKRRTGKSYAAVNRNIKLLLEKELTPILVVGETADEHGSGLARSVVENQITDSLKGISPARARRILTVYESLDYNADAFRISNFQLLIRSTLLRLFGKSAASNMRVLAGVKESTVITKNRTAKPITNDGFLVQGVKWLEPDAIEKMVQTIEPSKSAPAVPDTSEEDAEPKSELRFVEAEAPDQIKGSDAAVQEEGLARKLQELISQVDFSQAPERERIKAILWHAFTGETTLPVSKQGKTGIILSWSLFYKEGLYAVIPEFQKFFQNVEIAVVASQDDDMAFVYNLNKTISDPAHKILPSKSLSNLINRLRLRKVGVIKYVTNSKIEFDQLRNRIRDQIEFLFLTQDKLNEIRDIAALGSRLMQAKAVYFAFAGAA